MKKSALLLAVLFFAVAISAPAQMSMAQDKSKRPSPPANAECKFSDGKTVKIDMPEIRPIMQMKLQFRIRAEDGAPVAGEIYNTINWVP